MFTTKCVLCGKPLPHIGKCEEIERRDADQMVVPYRNRSAFLDSSPPTIFRSLLGDNLFDSMKIMGDSVDSIREVPTGNGGTSITGTRADGVKGYVYTHTISGDTQEINGELYLVVEERKRMEIRMKKEKKSFYDRLKIG